MNRYHEVKAEIQGRMVVLYRSESAAGVTLFRKLIGNRRFHGGNVSTLEVVTGRSKPTGILSPFVFKAA